MRALLPTGYRKACALVHSGHHVFATPCLHVYRELQHVLRGGVYRVVKEAMGSTLAKFSVFRLMFDYI